MGMRMTTHNVDKVNDMNEPMQVNGRMPSIDKPAATDWHENSQKDCHFNHAEHVVPLKSRNLAIWVRVALSGKRKT